MQQLLINSTRLIRGLRRRLRNTYYTQVLGGLGKECQICDNVLIADPHNVHIGDSVVVNECVVIQSCRGAGVTVGNLVTLSYGAKLITGGLVIGRHGAVPGEYDARPITLAESVWIGAGAIVLPGVTIGKGAVIAAGSVVNRDVEALTVVGGVPAKVLRRIDAKSVIA